MISEEKIKANRENGLKGGVKTDAGKAVSRLNAVSHGLFCREVLIKGEDASSLSVLSEKLTAELQPLGEMETILVERIISSTWRLRRALRSEKNYSTLPHRRDDENEEEIIAGGDYRYPSWQNYSRYETTLERQIYKALHELERLQRIRKGENIPAPLAIDVDVSEQEN
jgi:hypothetical protein